MNGGSKKTDVPIEKYSNALIINSRRRIEPIPMQKKDEPIE